MTVDGVTVRLRFGRPIRIGWWICEIRRDGIFDVVSFRFPRETEYLFVVDEAANGEWALYMDDDVAECLGPVRLCDDGISFEYSRALAKARALRAAMHAS